MRRLKAEGKLGAGREEGRRVGIPGLQGYGVTACRCMTVTLGGGEPEARRYTKMNKKGSIPLAPAIPGILIVRVIQAPCSHAEAQGDAGWGQLVKGYAAVFNGAGRKPILLAFARPPIRAN